jgi:hypothetical protein
LRTAQATVRKRKIRRVDFVNSEKEEKGKEKKRKGYIRRYDVLNKFINIFVFPIFLIKFQNIIFRLSNPRLLTITRLFAVNIIPILIRVKNDNYHIYGKIIEFRIINIEFRSRVICQGNGYLNLATDNILNDKYVVCVCNKLGILF